MKRFPALDAETSESDRLLADLDEFGPTALEERDTATRVFFSTADDRDRALAHLNASGTHATALDVPDEDWARRSQETITPVVVGRVCITPPWHRDHLAAPPALTALPAALTVVIEPSMGFGTGHHATTRLCVAALQAIDVRGKDVLDVGTGSGVLAITAAMLGAKHVVGIDYDTDAIENARDNLALNSEAGNVRFEVTDLARGLEPSSADVITANLTGALLQRAATQLLAALRPGGVLILSGLMTSERAGVEASFARATLADVREEDEWTALVYRRPPLGGPAARAASQPPTA